MRGIKIAAGIGRAVLIAVLTLALMCNLYLMAARSLTGEQPTLFGYSTAVVVSGSMSGTIDVDDMVIIHRQNSYSDGDVITYINSNSNLVTHRIYEVTKDGYITKGDANNTPDKEIVTKDNVVGIVVMVIPKIGLLISALKTPLGMLCIVLAGGLLAGTAFRNKESRKKGGIDNGKNIKK